MKSTIFIMILIAACKQPTVCAEHDSGPPAELPTDYSGIYELESSVTKEDCWVTNPAYKKVTCEKVLRKLLPSRLVMIDTKNHTATLGDDCKGKLFDEHLIASCETSRGSVKETRQYDVKFSGTSLKGTVRLLIHTDYVSDEIIADVTGRK